MVFENVVGLEPKNYIGDNMQKVTDVYRIAQYNVACCYSMINQTDAAVDALKAALISGFDDYKYATSPLPSPPLGWAKCRVPFAWVAPKQGPSQTSSRGVTLLPVGESDGVLWVLGTGTPRTAPIRHSLPPTHPQPAAWLCTSQQDAPAAALSGCKESREWTKDASYYIRESRQTVLVFVFQVRRHRDA